MTPREQTQARLDAYLAAELKILTGGQEYVIGQGATARRLTRADLPGVQKAIAELRAEIALLDAAAQGPRRIAYLRPFR